MLTLSNGDSPAVLAAQVLFFVLLPCVLFFPLRWAVLAWLLMGNLDATHAGDSLSSVGALNAAKSLVLPLYLIWRLRAVKSEVYRTKAAHLWIALTIYATAAALWGPFMVAGFKLAGNMAGIILGVIALEKAARKGLIDGRALQILIWTSLGLALVQTYYYDGLAFGFDGTDQSARFSSFIAAQQFAAFLVAFLTLALWHVDFGPKTRLITVCGVLAALVLNGSRVWFLGALLVVSVYMAMALRRYVVIFACALGTLVTAGLLASGFDPSTDFTVDNSSNRILATVNAAVTGADTSNRVGLRDLTFRTAIYNGIIDDILSARMFELVLGHGTSSGANSVLRIFQQLRLRASGSQPNRSQRVASAHLRMGVSGPPSNDQRFYDDDRRACWSALEKQD